MLTIILSLIVGAIFAIFATLGCSVTFPLWAMYQQASVVSL